MVSTQQATRIRLADLRSAPMRAFHMSWLAFFLCFFGWFGIAPLMPIVRDELGLSKAQVGNTIVASVAMTVVARLLIGWLCDRFGPRRTYGALLLSGAFPVAAIGLADSYETFLIARLCIGAIGASFVITQFHTSLMFAPNVVGTANATTAGWGNLGGGVTQFVMPLIVAALVSLGVEQGLGWRLAMVIPGALLFVVGIAYLVVTQDTPEGNFPELRASGRMLPSAGSRGSFAAAARDPRVWALFVIYGACFGVELTIHNVAALYFYDRFALDVTTAGLLAGLFGTMNLFARTLGGWLGDRAGRRAGLRGRVAILGIVLCAESAALVTFSQMNLLWASVVMLIVFSLFVQMSEGATFSVVPMINPQAMGSVSGIVGAGGNAGAVAAGYLFGVSGLSMQTAFAWIGLAVLAAASLVLVVRFLPAQERELANPLEASLGRGQTSPVINRGEL